MELRKVSNAPKSRSLVFNSLEVATLGHTFLSRWCSSFNRFGISVGTGITWFPLLGLVFIMVCRSQEVLLSYGPPWSCCWSLVLGFPPDAASWRDWCVDHQAVVFKISISYLIHRFYLHDRFQQGPLFTLWPSLTLQLQERLFKGERLLTRSVVKSLFSWEWVFYLPLDRFVIL